jgi:hypothetical protein
VGFDVRIEKRRLVTHVGSGLTVRQNKSGTPDRMRAPPPLCPAT